MNYGGKEADRETGAEREDRRVALPVPRGGHAGSRTDGDWKVHSKKAEAVTQYIATRPLLDLCEGARAREGARVPMMWWNQAEIDWETAKSKGVETDSTSGSGTDTDGEEEREEERKDASKASGSSGAEWSGASADEW